MFFVCASKLSLVVYTCHKNWESITIANTNKRLMGLYDLLSQCHWTDMFSGFLPELCDVEFIFT